MVADNELLEDRQDPSSGYLHYSVAKREGIRRGSTFETADGTACFTATEYVTWRPDINRAFAGFKLRLST